MEREGCNVDSCVPGSMKDAMSMAACNLFQWSEAERCFCRGGGLCFGTKPWMAWTACESLLSDTHGLGRHDGRRPQATASVFIFSPPPAPPKGGGYEKTIEYRFRSCLPSAPRLQDKFT